MPPVLHEKINGLIIIVIYSTYIQKFLLFTERFHNYSPMLHMIGISNLLHMIGILLSKDYLRLEILTEEFERHFSIFHNQLGFLHNRIFKAAAKYRLYGVEKGCPALLEAIDMAREDHLILPFAEYAPDILDMIRNISHTYPRDTYIKEVLKNKYGNDWAKGLVTVGNITMLWEDSRYGPEDLDYNTGFVFTSVNGVRCFISGRAAYSYGMEYQYEVLDFEYEVINSNPSIEEIDSIDYYNAGPISPYG